MLGNDRDSSMADATGVSTSSRLAQRRGQLVLPPSPTALQDSLPRSPVDRTDRTGPAALRFNPHSPAWTAYCKSPYRERSGSGLPRSSGSLCRSARDTALMTSRQFSRRRQLPERRLERMYGAAAPRSMGLFRHGNEPGQNRQPQLHGAGVPVEWPRECQVVQCPSPTQLPSLLLRSIFFGRRRSTTLPPIPSAISRRSIVPTHYARW